MQYTYYENKLSKIIFFSYFVILFLLQQLALTKFFKKTKHQEVIVISDDDEAPQNEGPQTVSLPNENKKDASTQTKPLIEIFRMECPICKEGVSMSESTSTTCGHIFCTKCIHTNLTYSQKCPFCRKPITTKQIHNLFFNFV